MELLVGVTVQSMRVSLNVIILKDSVTMYGWMEDSTRVHGGTTRCMVEGYSYGRMVVDMKESTRTIRNRVMVSLYGQMVVHTRAHGKMESRMVREHTGIRKGWRSRVHG